MEPEQCVCCKKRPVQNICSDCKEKFCASCFKVWFPPCYTCRREESTFPSNLAALSVIGEDDCCKVRLAKRLDQQFRSMKLELAAYQYFGTPAQFAAALSHFEACEFADGFDLTKL